jgi:hypothetical protein
MLSTAWMWVRLLGIATGIAAFWLGLSMMDDDDKPGLKFIAGGAGVIILLVAASFWRV